MGCGSTETLQAGDMQQIENKAKQTQIQPKKSKTEQNLLASLLSEQTTCQMYQMFAKQAKKEGFVYLSNIFEENAAMEQVHAARINSIIQNGKFDNSNKDVTLKVIKVGTTIQNVSASLAGEKEDGSVLYPEYARIARAEGFTEISKLFSDLAVIELQHATRFGRILELLQNEKVYELDDNVVWICMKCGYIHKGPKALKACPICAEINPFIPLNFDWFQLQQ